MADIDRREFLKLVGAGTVGAGAGFALAESIKHPVEHLIPYMVPPEEFSPGIATWYNTVCTLCTAGCGITVRTREGRAKKIEGNPLHPVSQGRLCALGQAGVQILYNPDRLTAPLKSAAERGSESYEEIPWEEGLSFVAERLTDLRSAGQADRICLLSEGVRGHLGEVFRVFMEAMPSQRLLYHDFHHPHTLYAAHKMLFGEDVLPYYDLQNTNYLLSFGADYLGAWLSPVHHSLGFGHSRQGRPGRRGVFVQIEPRLSLSGAAADEWIAAKPGTEGLLALALAHEIVDRGLYEGPDKDDWADVLRAFTPARVSTQCGVPAQRITHLAESFVHDGPGLAIGGGAAANHSNGTNTLLAINALNYLAGNLGEPGGVVFNPMPAAGRLSHPHQATYADMLKLADDARNGRIEVLIINNTNPAFTLPASAGFAEALAGIPLIVSLSSFLDETTLMADVILPSHSYLESWGDDFPEPGVGFPVGAVSQPVVAPLYNTRSTGDIVLALADRVGARAALPWDSMEACIRDGWRTLYQQGAEEEGGTGFEGFWQSVLKAGVWGREAHREQQPVALEKTVIDGIGFEAPEAAGSEDAYPFVLHPYLSLGFHDGRGANLPWMQELPDPMTSIVYGSWVEINPATAKDLGLREGDVVDVESPEGRVRAPVYVYPAIMPDVVAMPIGQGHRAYGRYAKGRGANPIEILAPVRDSRTGSLAWGGTRVRLSATGERVRIPKTGGESRQLGRKIIRTTGSDDESHASNLKGIPIKVVST